MPNKWNNDAMYTLLLKLVEQNPSCLSNYDKEQIRSTWPAGSDPPSSHMVPKLVTELRKIVEGGCHVPGNSTFSRTPSTPTTSAKKRHVTANKKSTAPVSPTKRPLSNNDTTASRRVHPKKTSTSTPSSSSNKPNPKKKRNGFTSESESAASSLHSSDSASDNNSSDSDNDAHQPISTKPLGTPRRTLPQRSKSRSLSYAVLTAASSGEDEAAKDIDSEDEFHVSDSGDVKMGDGSREVDEDRETSCGRRLSAGSDCFHDAREDAREELEG